MIKNLKRIKSSYLIIIGVLLIVVSGKLGATSHTESVLAVTGRVFIYVAIAKFILSIAIENKADLRKWCDKYVTKNVEDYFNIWKSIYTLWSTRQSKKQLLAMLFLIFQLAYTALIVLAAYVIIVGGYQALTSHSPPCTPTDGFNCE